MSVFCPTKRQDAASPRARARTMSPSVGVSMNVSPRVAKAEHKRQPQSSRQVFEGRPGQMMEYELMLPAGHNPEVPIPFVLSVSGTGQQHVNGFGRRLVSDNWAVVAALRPEGAPLMFEGTGREGDGVWYLYRLCQHLLERFAVDTSRFLLAGVSNGGMSVLRFATIWPQLCRGLVVATGHLKGIASDADLQRLQGLPIDMYVGTLDECGMFPPMQELESKLRSFGQSPMPELTIFQGAGHCISPMIDSRLLFGKIRLMLSHSGARDQRVCIHIESHCDALSRLPSEQVYSQLLAFSQRLGLHNVLDEAAAVCHSSENPPPRKRPRAVTFSPTLQTDGHAQHEHHQHQVRFTEETGRAKPVDALTSHGDQRRKRVASVGDAEDMSCQTQRVEPTLRARAVSFADGANHAGEGCHAPSGRRQVTLPFHGRSLNANSPRAETTANSGSPLQSSVSPVANQIALQPRAQTVTTSIGMSVAETHSAIRQQQRSKTMQCGAQVQCRAIPTLAHLQLLVLR